MIATTRCRDIVKRAAITRIIVKQRVPAPQAEELYDHYMDKLALGVPGLQQGTLSASGPGTNVGNVINPPTNSLHLDVAQNAVGTAAQQNSGNKQDVNNKQVAQVPPKPSNALNIINQQPTIQQPQGNTGMLAQASAALPTDQQLLICKTAHILTLSQNGIHPDVALKLFDNTLNKCGHVLFNNSK